MLIELLRSWDFRLKGDLEGEGGEDKRPKSWIMDLAVTPNTFAEIEFKKRQS